MNEYDGLLSNENTSTTDQIKRFIMSSKISYLLIFVPIGILAEFIGFSSTWIFILNFLAIIPLAKLLGQATEDISTKVGPTVGGLLNATFGNAVELIVSIIALQKGLLKVVQASILGSILSNLLLVLGFCFFFGGLKYKEQNFNMTGAQTSSSLLSLSVLSLLIPAAFRNAFGSSDKNIEQDIISLSHGTAIILLFVYCGYLYFQLKSHQYLFESEEENEEESHNSLNFSLICLLIITIVVSISAEFLVGSIEGLTKQLNLSETFVGIILVPIVGNAAEHLTAVTVALKNKMDLSIGVALGSSIQIALLVTPVLVLLGWIIGQPLTLFFDTFETCVLFISVLIVNYLIMDGKSNWLEGFMLLAVYFILGIAFYISPV